MSITASLLAPPQPSTRNHILSTLPPEDFERLSADLEAKVIFAHPEQMNILKNL